MVYPHWYDTASLSHIIYHQNSGWENIRHHQVITSQYISTQDIISVHGNTCGCGTHAFTTITTTSQYPYHTGQLPNSITTSYISYLQLCSSVADKKLANYPPPLPRMKSDTTFYNPLLITPDAPQPRVKELDDLDRNKQRNNITMEFSHKCHQKYPPQQHHTSSHTTQCPCRWQTINMMVHQNRCLPFTYITRGHKKYRSRTSWQNIWPQSIHKYITLSLSETGLKSTHQDNIGLSSTTGWDVSLCNQVGRISLYIQTQETPKNTYTWRRARRDQNGKNKFVMK